jgi:hypothetical protein
VSPTDLFVEFSSYLQQPATLRAVALPALVALWLWRRSRRCGERQPHAQAFILGTALSILFSVWVERGDELSLHMLPGYFVAIVFAPARYRPSAARVYALTFLSLLTADVICAAQYFFFQVGHLPADFFRGVGGAGFGDALFWVPAFAALYVHVLARIEAHPLAHTSLFSLHRTLSSESHAAAGFTRSRRV